MKYKILPLICVVFANCAFGQTVVSSITELVAHLGDSNANIVMTPGTYQIGPDDVTSGLLDDGDVTLLKFTGNNSTFDFTGVTIEYDTYVYRSFGSVDMRSIEVAGEDLILKNLTTVDIGTARPGKTALAVYLNGRRNLVEGFTMTLRGSIPYGYGDIFGKGSGSVIGHRKHSAILIGGDDNTLRGATIYHRAYGHGIFVQGAINTLIEDCYVEGELSTTDKVLAEAGTGSRADDVAFQTVWGFPLRAGNTFSLQEDGIRAYNTGPDPDGVTRNTENLEVKNCTVYRMRSGVTIGFTNGTQLVENCVAIQCENAYWIQRGDIVNSAADSQVGMVLSSPYGNSGVKNVDVTIVKNDDEGAEDNRVLAYIAGSNDNITFRSSSANTSVNQNTKLVVGGPRDLFRYETTDVGLSASSGVINNLTNYPVNLSSISSNMTGISWGTVTDNGSSNNLTSTSNSACGGFSMMQMIQAEDYCSQSGTTEQPTNDGGTSVGDIQDGDWLRFDDVFFGSGPKYIEALVAGGINGGSIEVRLNSTTGTLLSTLSVSGSATSGNWITESAAITHTQGKQDVYLVFTGGAGDLFELDTFRFTERNFDPYNRETDHLIAHYKFDEGTGTTATDSTGNGYDGTISNAAWVAGAEQSALAFDGSSSTVDIPATLLSHMDEEITISLWVYGDNAQPHADSVFYAQAAGGERILNAHLPYTDSNIYWDSGDSSGYNRTQKLATTDQFKGRWNHWTFVKGTTVSDATIYLNGVLFAAEQNGTNMIGDAVVASIGSRLGGSNYLGTIDEVKFYNVALSRNEIEELYESYDPNGAPIAIPNNVTARQNVDISITLEGTDLNGDTLTYAVASNPSFGSISGTAPNLVYTPNFDYTGNDSFTFTVNDGSNDSAPATVDITVINGKLLAHWPLDDASGTAVADVSGNHQDATLDSGTWASGLKGGALSFDGTIDKVTLPLSAFSEISDEVTISMWTYGDASLPANTVALEGLSGTSRAYNIHLPFGNSRVYWDAGGSSGYDRIFKDASTSDFKDQWNHWVFSKNTTTGIMNVHLNGQPWASGSGKTKPLTALTAVTLGNTAASSTGYIGLLDDVKIFNYAMSDSEVSDLHDTYFTNQAPSFISDPTSATNAVVDVAYTDSINGSAFDPDADTLTYSKLSGPTWLSVATDGSLSGMPDSGDIGLNVFTVQVDATGGSDIATLNITVELATYTLTYNAGANGSISGTSPEVVSEGDDGSSVTAVADIGYTFVDWSDSSTDNPRTDTNVMSDITVTANFEAIPNKDAFSTIEAEDYDYQSGIDTEACSEGGLNIGFIQDNDWTAYYNVDFGSGANEFQARVASKSSGGNIEIRLDSPSGTLLGTAVVVNTSSANWQTWTTVKASISSVSGVHDVYLVYTDGGGSYLFNVNWLTFAKTYTLSYTAGSGGSIFGSSPQIIYDGSDGSAVTAVPNENYYFVDWSDGSTSNPRTDINVISDTALTANFKAMTPAEIWRNDNFGNYTNTGSGAETANPDTDSLVNLLEFAFGTDPNMNDSDPLTVDEESGDFTPGTPVVDVEFDPLSVKARFVRRVDHASSGITYTAQFSHDLNTWDDLSGSSAVRISGISESDGYEAVELDYPVFLSNGRKARFYRIEINDTESDETQP